MDWERNQSNIPLSKNYKQHKFLEITLTKQVKDLYDKKLKSLKNKTEEDISEDGKISHAPGEGDLK